MEEMIQKTNHLAKLNRCYSLHMYGINKKFLPILVPWLLTQKTKIDISIGDRTVPFRDCYITIPMVAIQRESYSDIEKTNVNYDIPMARYNLFLKRMK